MKKILGDVIPGTQKQRCFRTRTYEGGRRLIFIADGMTSGIIDEQSTPWDYAAGTILVQEAGGTVTNHNNEPWTIHQKDILLTNGIIHDEILAVLHEAKKN